MKIAYVTKDDPQDLHAWSGTVANIYKALEDAGHEMIPVGNLKETYKIPLKLLQILIKLFTGKRYLGEREPIVVKDFARQIKKRLSVIEYDVVLSPGTLPIAKLDIEKPIVFWTDVSFAGIIGFYDEFKNLTQRTIRNGNAAEQKALTNCSLALYSLDWAAQTAIENYNVDPEKVKVVPFGANIECNRTEADIQALVDKKQFDVCKLVLIGVEWKRKGGDLAVQVAQRLNDQGLVTELHVVGCEPDGDVPDFVKQHGFVSKKTEAGRQKLDGLFSTAHFLIVPSQAECFGLVYCEASSFGVPSLATQTGGIPTIVKQGKNGFIFSLDAGPEPYCEYIGRYIASPSDYKKLARTSFNEYSKRLNWRVAGGDVSDLMGNLSAPDTVSTGKDTGQR